LPLSRQRRADRLAETLGIRRTFGEDDVVVDDQSFLNVLCAGILQLLDSLWKEVYCGLPAGEQFRLGDRQIAAAILPAPDMAVANS